jgi:Zn-dependent protease with chaperone function
VSAAPISARYYPPSGDAHGHPALLRWEGGHLLVAPEDAEPLRVRAAALRAEARGFNHSQWAIAWPGDGGEHLLIVADAAIAPLRAAAPALFAPGAHAQRKTHRRFGLGVMALILLPLLLIAGIFLAVEPLADRVVEHIPPSIENQIGEAVLARTRLDSKLIEQGPAVDALQVIGKRLARPGENLRFYLAERPDINAFAAPGGVVVVYSGLLKQATSAEDVAGVLAHEIAHVELRHSLRQIVRSAGLRVIVSALFGDYGALGGWSARLGELKFSRDAEREADARGLQRLAEARIDPQGMLRFFESLARSESSTTSAVPTVFSTHPATAERIERLREALAKHPAGTTQPIPLDWQAVRQALPAPKP